MIPEKLFYFLTTRARAAVIESIRLSRHYPAQKQGPVVTPQHLLCALGEANGSLARAILSSHNLKEVRLLQHLKKHAEPHAQPDAENRGFSSPYKKAVKKAAHYAMRHGHALIGTEHLLYGLLPYLNEIEGITRIQQTKVKNHLRSLMANTVPPALHLDPSFERLDEALQDMNMEKDVIDIASHHKRTANPLNEERESHESFLPFSTRVAQRRSPSVLEDFCDNISQKARDGKLDPLVGREQELQRMIRILSRRTKNNPLIIGDAGVGKTALVHGLAQKIVEGSVPSHLIQKRIYALNLSSLLAGTVYRGEFEERMRDLLEEVMKGDVMLFIDEVHMLIGAGAAQGSLDAANILKPALVKGAFQCIGATTYDEFKKTIERDTALERRFQKILIREQTAQEALETLKRLKPLYEKYHAVVIPDDILTLCVTYGLRYLPNRSLPDKALDLLDEAASCARGTVEGNKELVQFSNLKRELKTILQEKEEALAKEHYKKAMLLKNKEEILAYALNQLNNEMPNTSKPITVTTAMLRHVAADMTSIPLQELSENETQALATLEETMQKEIIGQEHVVKRVVAILRKNRAGLQDASRPLGSFLFLGPSGVGKTECAKVLARMLNKEKGIAQAPSTTHDDAPRSLIKLDMSEFSEPHAIARLTGAPPGYVGYEEAGYLTEQVRKNPYAVVLFDEIEKAHPKVFQILLQILEDGVLTDAMGKTARFHNAIIILTANSGSEYFTNSGTFGFAGSHVPQAAKNQQQALEALKRDIRPEILNRLDEIMVFHGLTDAALKKIAQLNLDRLQRRVKETVELTIQPAVAGWIVRTIKQRARGAREIRSLIEKHIETQLTDYVLNKKAKIVSVGVGTKGLTFRVP